MLLAILPSFPLVLVTIAYSDAIRPNGSSIQCDTEDMLTINVPNVMTSECLYRYFF